MARCLRHEGILDKNVAVWLAVLGFGALVRWTIERPRRGVCWSADGLERGWPSNYGLATTCERFCPFTSKVMPFIVTVPLVLSSISLPTSSRVTHSSVE